MLTTKLSDPSPVTLDMQVRRRGSLQPVWAVCVS